MIEYGMTLLVLSRSLPVLHIGIYSLSTAILLFMLVHCSSFQGLRETFAGCAFVCSVVCLEEQSNEFSNFLDSESYLE